MKHKLVCRVMAVILVLGMICFSGCGQYTGTNGGKTKYQDVSTEVTRFEMTYYSSTAPVTCVFEKRDEGWFFKSDQYQEENDLIGISDDTFILINEWVDQYKIRAWDGFDKKRKGVMDGGGFKLFITLKTGETISAHGSNAYPKGYAEAKDALSGIIKAAKAEAEHNRE